MRCYFGWMPFNDQGEYQGERDSRGSPGDCGDRFSPNRKPAPKHHDSMTQDGILGAAAGKSVWDSLQECGTRTHGPVVAPAPANGLAFWPKWSGAIDDSS